MRHAGVESVVQAVAFEVDVFGYAIIERIITEIVTVQLARQIRVPYVIDLRYPRQCVPGRSIGLSRRDRRRLEK